MVDIGKEVPGFGGLRLDPHNPDVLKVFLLDPDGPKHKEAVEDAIMEIIPGALPHGGIQAVQGQHSILELKEWYDEVRATIARSEWIVEGLSLTDLEEDPNRIAIGVVSEKYVREMESTLAETSIPSEAVRIAVRERFGELQSYRR